MTLVSLSCVCVCGACVYIICIFLHTFFCTLYWCGRVKLYVWLSCVVLLHVVHCGQPLGNQELWKFVHSVYGEELGFSSNDDETDAAQLSTPSDVVVHHSRHHHRTTGGGGGGGGLSSSPSLSLHSAQTSNDDDSLKQLDIRDAREVSISLFLSPARPSFSPPENIIQHPPRFFFFFFFFFFFPSFLNNSLGRHVAPATPQFSGWWVGGALDWPQAI